MHGGDNFEKSMTNVVPFGIGTADMKHPALAQIEGYWDALRGDRITPLRSEVDPRGIDRALENAFILERIAPGTARFRLAGMHLNDLMGMEVRGMPITSFLVRDDRSRLSEALEHVFEEPAKARVMLKSSNPLSSGAEAEILLLPLRSDLGDVSRALGCLVSHGTKGAPPHRFEIASLELQQLMVQEREAQQYRQSGQDTPGRVLQEPQATYHAPRRGTPPQSPAPKGTDSNVQHPHLRLVHTRDD